MSKTKAKTKLVIDTSQERIIAAARFQAGDRVRHITSGRVGTFDEVHNGFALPDAWVLFDSEFDRPPVPITVNPLELEFERCSDIQALACFPESEDLSSDSNCQDLVIPSESPNLSSAILTAKESLENTGPMSPSGTTLEPTTQQELTEAEPSFLVDSPAKTSPLPEKKQELTDLDPGCSLKSFALFAWYDPDSSSWKTSQGCLLTGWESYSGSFPKSGTMRNGQLFHASRWVESTAASESSSSPTLLPTPTAADGTMAAILNENTQIRYTSNGTPRKVSNQGVDGSVGLGRYLQLMLPTPKAVDGQHPGIQSHKQGQTLHLSAAVQKQTLSTARDWKDGMADVETPISENLNDQMVSITGKPKLAPAFVEAMLGFPPAWTDLDDETTSCDTLTSLGGYPEAQIPTTSPTGESDLKPSETVSRLMQLQLPGEESPISTPSTDRDGYLDLRLISTDGGTQSRAGLNEQTIDEYAEAMDAGAAFPPVLVFYDGEEYWLADGFHRVASAKRLEWTDIAVEIRSGTRRDAVLYSVGANAEHGLRRTNADKRRAVLTLLGDEEWSQWSFNKIAKYCSVSVGLVHKLFHGDSSFHSEKMKPEARVVERNGQNYAQDTTKIGKKSQVSIDSCRKGGVYMISAKSNPDLRRFDGEWVVAKEVNEYSITIAVRREDTPVAPQFLKKVDSEHWAEIQAINARIDRLFQCELDPIDDAALELLKRRTCFSDRQKLVLKRMEEDYGLNLHFNSASDQYSKNTIDGTYEKT